MNDDKPTVTLGTSDTLTNNTQPTIVVLQISRAEIEACNIASALDHLLVLIDSPANVMLYRESVTFMITGFDDDQRELPEIPEVRAYFKRLVADWPHWLWFLVRGSGAIPIFMACLCDVVVHRSRAPGVYYTEFIDPEQVQGVLFNLIGRGNVLFKAMNIGFDLADKSLETALQEVVGAIG